MKFEPPKSVKLTDDELKWYKQIPLEPDRNTQWEPIADLMETLFISLCKRNAIPDIRLRLFDDPKLSETHSKSPKQIFESNGTSGDAICRHPHFIEYLRYFIKGPELPAKAVSGFCNILNDDRGTSGMILKQLQSYVRSCVRDYKLNPRSAASEFYKLAVELDIHFDWHDIRQAAMSTR